MYLEDWVWEKGGGILDGHPLTEFRAMALDSDEGLRRFKVKDGESWDDVHAWAWDFLCSMLKTIDECDEEEKWVYVENIEEEIWTCTGGGKIPPKNEKDLEDKINPKIS